MSSGHGQLVRLVSSRLSGRFTHRSYLLPSSSRLSRRFTHRRYLLPSVVDIVPNHFTQKYKLKHPKENLRFGSSIPNPHIHTHSTVALPTLRFGSDGAVVVRQHPLASHRREALCSVGQPRFRECGHTKSATHPCHHLHAQSGRRCFDSSSLRSSREDHSSPRRTDYPHECTLDPRTRCPSFVACIEDLAGSCNTA
jgi:hypothetical protein